MATFDDTYDESRNLVEVEFQNGRDVKANELVEAQRIERVRRRRSFDSIKPDSFNGDGFKVVENTADTVNKIKVSAGDGFIGGEYLNLENDLVVENLTTPGAPRVDEVYVEVREVERTSADFPDIGDSDIGETTTRLQLTFSLNVAEGATTPSSTGELHEGGIVRVHIATLNRDANSSVLTAEIVDARNLIGFGVALGGTGVSSFDDGAVVVGGGGDNPLEQVVTPANNEQTFLMSNGPSANPSYAHPVPIGTVIDWYRDNAGIAIPTGWLFCDGSVISEANSPINGSTLPDLRDKFVRGTPNTTAGFTSGGSDTANLAHSHTVNSHNHGLNSHTHTVNNHDHSLPSDTAGVSASGSIPNNAMRLRDDQNEGNARHINQVENGTTSPSNDGQHIHDLGGDTGNSSPGTGGPSTSNTTSTSPGTNSQLSGTESIIPAYVGLIKLMKVF